MKMQLGKLRTSVCKLSQIMLFAVEHTETISHQTYLPIFAIVRTTWKATRAYDRPRAAHPLLQKQFIVSAGNQSLVPISEYDTLCVIQKMGHFYVG
jgi:hypothetical protein